MKRSEYFLGEAFEIKRSLLQYLRHPLQEIKHVPDWPWHRILALQVGIAAVTGALGGFADQRIVWSMIAGFFLTPIVTLITLTISTLFFYYCFQIFADKTIAPRRLFTVVLFANIPQFIFRIIEGFVPPMALVGMAFTALLLVVGFVENFQLNKKLALKVIGFLYAILFALWVYSQISAARSNRTWNFDRNEAPEVELGK